MHPPTSPLPPRFAFDAGGGAGNGEEAADVADEADAPGNFVTGNRKHK